MVDPRYVSLFWLKIQLTLTITIGAILTPCNFPTPHQQRSFKKHCGSYVNLSYLCDYDQKLSLSEASIIDKAYTKYKSVFTDPAGRSQIAITIVQDVKVPVDHKDFYQLTEFQCLRDRDGLAADVVQLMETLNFYLDTFIQTLHLRWFGLSENPCDYHILIFLVVHGVPTNDEFDSQMRPLVKISAGQLLTQQRAGCHRTAIIATHKAHAIVKDLEELAQNRYLSGWNLGVVIERLLLKLGPELEELRRTGGRPPKHSIPKWAWHSFIGCALLIICAMMLEYCIVRRNTGAKRSSSGGGGPVAAPKAGRTHLMF